MMGKKRKLIAAVLVLALLVVPVVVYSQAVPAVAIWGVSMSGAAWTAASELVLTVRAALAAPAFYSAASWVTSTLAPAAASTAVGIAVTGSMVLAAGWTAYMAYKGWEYIDGVLNTTDGPITHLGVGLMSWVMGDGSDGQAYPVTTEQEAVIQCGSGCTTGSGCYSGGQWDSAYWGNKAKCVTIHCYYYLYPTQTGTAEPISAEDAANVVKTDLEGVDETAKAKAKDAVLAATAAVTDAYNDAKKANVYPPLAVPGGQVVPSNLWDSWERHLKEGIPDATKEGMGAQDIPDNYGKDTTNPPVQTVGTTQPAINNITVNVNLPEPPVPDDPPPVNLGDDPDPPDKSSLTSILQDYTDNLETLPIVGIVSGAHLEIAGADPVLDLPVTIPPNPPVNVRIDFSKYESIVDTLGTLMLTYVSIIWTVWLFKGRGDA